MSINGRTIRIAKYKFRFVLIIGVFNGNLHIILILRIKRYIQALVVIDISKTIKH